MAEDVKIKHIIRIASTDIPGQKKLGFSLRHIKGINFMLARAICTVSGISYTKKAGSLSESEVQKLNDVIERPASHGIPIWMLNRRKDVETGEDMHLIGNDLSFQKENDIKLLKKIKCYRGIRHMFRLTSRGQRTKSNFRKKKGRGGKLTGVVKKKGKK